MCITPSLCNTAPENLYAKPCTPLKLGYLIECLVEAIQSHLCFYHPTQHTPQETQPGLRNHVGQIRFHQDPQGGPLPVLPNRRAQRSHEVRTTQVSQQHLRAGPNCCPQGSDAEQGEATPYLRAIANTNTPLQVILAPCIPDYEEEQPADPHHAARSSRHFAQGVCEIRYAVHDYKHSLPSRIDIRRGRMLTASRRVWKGDEPEPRRFIR